MNEERFMRRALSLARRGRGKVSPNPMVGCVLVKGGRVVGEGWHARFGGPHAEPRALKAAGKRARGATAYVTLEPCCYHGKTPPCTAALTQAGVRRVVAGARDPNPRVSGRGLAALRRAGIRTQLGLLAKEAAALYRPFSVFIRQRRPYVILKAAASLDGRIETASGQSKWITSPEARALSRRMRSEVDAILVGVETVKADDPRLTASGGRNPVRIILDSKLRAPRNARVFRGPGRAIVATAVSFNGRRPLPRVDHLRIPRRKGGLDLGFLLRRLAAQGIGTLLIEGGSAVHTSFLEADLVDELRLFMAPRLIGGAGARSFFEGRGFRRLSRSLSLTDVRVRTIGGDLLVTGLVPGRR